MNDTDQAAATPAAPSPLPPPAAVAPAPTAPPAGPGLAGQGWMVAVGLMGALSVVAITMALLGQQRLKSLEQELLRRQQESQTQSVESRALSKQAQDTARSTESKLLVLEARVAETALQRTQLEELMAQLSRSRDENVLADVDAAIRVAAQQSALTGSTEPMAAALRQAEERLARLNQPRVERVRRAVARDLDRVRAVAVTDVASLTIKLDEAIRTIDELPLVAQPERREPVAAPKPASAASKPAPAAKGDAAWWAWAQSQWDWASGRVWGEVRNLVRVTRIDNPEAVLVAPEQAWFLRENLKLRLLNARLALLSRQFDTAQSDLRESQGVLDRYFDRTARRVVLTTDLVRQVAGQARQLNLPRPDETLSALTAAQAGR